VIRDADQQAPPAHGGRQLAPDEDGVRAHFGAPP